MLAVVSLDSGKMGIVSVKRLQQVKLKSSLKIIYLVRGKKTDTVTLYIPYDKPVEAPINVSDSLTKQAIQTSAKVPDKPEPQVPGTGIVATQDKPRLDSTAVKTSKKVQLINSDCKNFATENDVDNLRVKIISETDEDKKIAISKKYFKTKCFTVNQIKALSELFASDQWRYSFFATSYPFISDAENFSQLDQLLSEQQYLDQFHALIRH